MPEKICCVESECRRDNQKSFTVCHNPIVWLDKFEKKCPVRKELEMQAENQAAITVQPDLFNQVDLKNRRIK